MRYEIAENAYKINDFKYDKVYFGSSNKISNPMKLDRPLFVSPFIGIASIFAVRPQDLSKYGVPRGMPINLGYDEWNRKYANSILLEPLKEVHVRIEGFPECKPTIEMRNGYIYEIDISELKNNIYQTSKMNDLFEFLIDGVPEVEFSDVMEVDIKMHIRGEELNVQESYNKTKIKENDHMSERISLDMDIDDYLFQEGVSDNGFSNLRAKIAKALGENFKVTNVVKGTEGRDKFDITEKESDIDSIKTTVESTDNGCKVTSRGDSKFKCHFINIPLSQALTKIVSLFEKPEMLLENAFYDINRFGGTLFTESDTDGTNDDNGDESTDMPEMVEKDNDSEEEKVTDDESEETTDDGDDSDLSSFGSDNSDIQNDFNPKDIEILNKLIASESEAINEYFDGAKDVHDENLRRLYGDIGHEERFHLEQLLYAKSTLTGEKYEPRDPDVKKEYEELVAMGMDDDTAASTAIDKTSMNGHDNGNDSDMEELKQEAAIIETLLYHNEILANICEQFNPKQMDESLAIFVESFFQEEMDNVAQAPKQVTKIQDPITLLTKILKGAINGILKLSSVTRDSIAKNKLKNYRKQEWIKKHGIGDLFKNGIHLYFYSDRKSIYDFDEPSRYVDLLYRMTKMIGKNCGIQLSDANRKTVKDPIKFRDIPEALRILKNVILTKTKVVVTDSNKDLLAREFFGYSDKKIDVSVSRDSGRTVNDSANIYNKIDVMSAITKDYCQISMDMLDKLKNLEGTANSIYYKNRKLYNDSLNSMKEIVGRYNQFIKCMAHDLKVILTLDNGILEMTRNRDETEQTGGKWNGDDVRTPDGNSSRKPTQPVMKNKKGFFNKNK